MENKLSWQLGWVGEKYYASGPSLAAAFLDGLLNCLLTVRELSSTVDILCFPESLSYFSIAWSSRE